MKSALHVYRNILDFNFLLSVLEQMKLPKRSQQDSTSYRLAHGSHRPSELVAVQSLHEQQEDIM
jgi:hypothetical protein